MLTRRTGALTSKSVLKAVPSDLAEKAGTNLPGIPHAKRVPRLYRQWLKLAVACPTSQLCELNSRTQMNERFMIILRQKFREGAGERDPERVRVLVQSCERSLAMFREIAADSAKRKFPEARPRVHLERAGHLNLTKVNFKQMFKEYVNCYLKRKW
uniref:Uncharacterized protein n=1 Tax=Neobodo designis TaxID=312471 RepID=A0A7S1Q788_NEODS|mmetsp:Transcript_32988/g.101893  ORF Transcript_32988/g.101893 Transcript_32988/m.101893 type:complete len:156 (+) Transcript_32988:29-496(+)